MTAYVNMLKRNVCREDETGNEETAVAVVESDDTQGKVITIPNYHQQETWENVHYNTHLQDALQEDLIKKNASTKLF